MAITSKRARFNFLAKPAVCLIDPSPTEQFMWEDSHKEELLLWKHRVRMSRKFYSKEENSHFAVLRAQHLHEAIVDESSGKGSEPYTVTQQVPWNALVQMATGKTIDVIRSRKRAPVMCQVERQPSKTKKVSFSGSTLVQCEYILTEQCVFTKAHRMKLNTFNARVRMSRMFQHEINEEQASIRARNCQDDVKQEAEEMSFVLSAFEEASQPEISCDSESLKGFAVLDNACVLKRSCKHQDACTGKLPIVAPSAARKIAPWDGRHFRQKDASTHNFAGDVSNAALVPVA
eukprot:TRINITY_DN6615_c0_g1_i1.p1 TRINITY_DN6615_c0_g1~~TRINITY_DN6615_c0_g1_i1.p1  ORF type:complete len:289 (-),score=42.55 TRINITY_DN6615_c0_g1_i1:1042-1908(-)